MKVTIHRGAHEIGGTCIRLSTEQSSILLDLGLSLSKDSKEIDVAALKPDAVIISHPHQDHFGLIEALKPDVPVYMGELSKNLINATKMLLGNDLLKNEILYFKPWQSFAIGDFTITPYLMDHSAVDAYGFLIEAEGKRVFYSGDFRAHGRKSILFDKIIKNPPKDIDLLFMEGTMIQRSNDDFPTESDVEEKIYETIKAQENITFLISSSQNIDRIVSAFRACLRAGKSLVLDIYTAWVLEQLKLVSKNIPAMEWDQVKVKLSFSQHEKLKDNPDFFGDFRKRVYQHRISKEELQANPADYLYLGKMSHFKTINFYKGIKPVNVIYSQWLGYLSCKDEDYFGAEAMAGYRNDPQVNFVYAHTSGHATVEDLQKFAEALKPKILVPVHTEHGEEYKTIFNYVVQIHDNETMELWPMEGKMYYDRAISPELESKFKKDFNWLYEFVKRREDLDFLIGANKSIEWVSVYRGTSRIFRIVKGKRPDSIIKIDGAEAYMTLAGSLNTYIYTDAIDNFSNFEEHLKTLLDRVSHEDKFKRYYDNMKEGFYQNILSRKYGINSLPDAEFVIIDKEVVIGYEDQKEKDNIFGEKQTKFKDLLKEISLLDPLKYGKDLEKKAIGNELDFLAWKSDGTLLLIELKHRTNASGIYLSPLQIGLYAEIFEHYKEKNETDFYSSLKRMVEQKQRIGLIHKDWKIPAEITSIKPMLIISEFNPKSSAMVKFSEILTKCRKQFGEAFLHSIEVCSYSCQQDKLEQIYPAINTRVMKWLTILKISGEGGCVKILGQDNGNDAWKYKLTTYESAMSDLLSEEDAEGMIFSSTSPVVEDWDSVIQLLGRKYPHWMDLYQIECHPLFRNKISELRGDHNRASKDLNTTNISLEKARQLFQKAGFDLPAIPYKLASSLKQQSELDFSTRTLPNSVNHIDFYVDEVNKSQVEDYAILSRTVWSPPVNTIHYFLVSGQLRMFLQLCWGGFRIDADVLDDQIREIRECFSLADQIVPLAMAVCKSGERLTIVAQSLGRNNYWVAPGQDAQEVKRQCNHPKEVLSESLQWLRSSVGDGMNFMEDVLKLAEEMDGKEREEFLAMAEQIDREEDEFEQRKILYLSDYRNRRKPI